MVCTDFVKKDVYFMVLIYTLVDILQRANVDLSQPFHGPFRTDQLDLSLLNGPCAGIMDYTVCALERAKCFYQL